MSLSVRAASAATAAIAKIHLAGANATGHEKSPAKQARLADPSAKGAAFGALVSQLARAKHAPAAATPPATEPEIVAETPTETEPGAVVDVVV